MIVSVACFMRDHFFLFFLCDKVHILSVVVHSKWSTDSSSPNCACTFFSVNISVTSFMPLYFRCNDTFVQFSQHRKHTVVVSFLHPRVCSDQYGLSPANYTRYKNNTLFSSKWSYRVILTLQKKSNEYNSPDPNTACFSLVIVEQLFSQ